MKKCEHIGCVRPFYGVSWCRLHWRRWKKHGNTTEDGKKHGLADSAMYKRWSSIKARTGRKSANGYKNYGGRGITMCNEWRNSFIAFYLYMGKPPFDKATIERIDNERGYEPGNVRWASYHEQALNKRNLTLNKTGYANVYRSKKTFYVMYSMYGIRYYIGPFKDADSANRAFIRDKQKHEIRTA